MKGNPEVSDVPVSPDGGATKGDFQKPWNPTAGENHCGAFPEPPIHGINNWTFKAALHSKRSGLSPEEAEEKIRSYESNNRRPFKTGEVERAVANAYGKPTPTGTRGERKPKPQQSDPVAIKAVIEASKIKSLQQLAALSDPVPDVDAADHVIDALFQGYPPGYPLLCIARGSATNFRTVPREEARGRLGEDTFIVPSPMTAPEGMKADGKGLSEHTLDNTGDRKYLVVEFDGIRELDDQAAIIGHLMRYAPLVCVVFSGSKSAHAWFHVDGLPEDEVLRFFSYAIKLGADPKMWSRCQFARLPGGWNHNKQARQKVLYFKPGARMDTLPPPPGSMPEYVWSLRDAAKEWTSDPAEIANMSSPPIVEGILRDGDTGTIVGGAKTHKTWIALHLGVCVAQGSLFLGRKVWKRRVLYLDYELKGQTFRKRLSMIAAAPPEGLYYQTLRGSDRLPTMREIEELIVTENIELVILDPLYRTGLLREENSNDATGRDLMALQNMATRTGAAVLVVDHTAKGGGNERSAVDAARGASAKGGFFDTIMVLRPKPCEDPSVSLVVLDAVVRDWPMTAELPVAALQWDGTQCHLKLSGSISRDDASMISARIVGLLEANESPMGIKDICEALSLPETTVRITLKKLVAGGRIGDIQDPRHSQRRLFHGVDRLGVTETGTEGDQ